MTEEGAMGAQRSRRETGLRFVRRGCTAVLYSHVQSASWLMLGRLRMHPFRIFLSTTGWCVRRRCGFLIVCALYAARGDPTALIEAKR